MPRRLPRRLAIGAAAAACLTALVLSAAGLRASSPASLSDTPASTQPSALRVHIVDYASVATSEISLAESEATRLWQAIDVGVTWQDGEAPPDAHVVIHSPRALDVTVVLLRQDMAQRMILAEHRGDGVLGRAVPEALRAYVFYDRVRKASDELDAPRDAVLGRVVAHELAHLLLGHTHSNSGLFRAQPDLGSRREAFDSRDGARIRAEILAASAPSIERRTVR